MKTIRQAFKEAPRSIALYLILLVVGFGFIIYGIVSQGWTYLLWFALLFAFLTGLRLASAWAARKDGIEDER